uniref:Uncharacterized protein n=1 Tax=Timema bartmani TaxID=61472 RepID=A0A7R9F0V3_9NEOP|nr:unnamed protein product [Timema bartmani]
MKKEERKAWLFPALYRLCLVAAFLDLSTDVLMEVELVRFFSSSLACYKELYSERKHATRQLSLDYFIKEVETRQYKDPGTSHKQELAIPGPSREQEPTVLRTSCQQELTVPGPSREQERTIPGSSRASRPRTFKKSRASHPRAVKRARVYCQEPDNVVLLLVSMLAPNLTKETNDTALLVSQVNSSPVPKWRPDATVQHFPRDVSGLHQYSLIDVPYRSCPSDAVILSVSSTQGYSYDTMSYDGHPSYSLGAWRYDNDPSGHYYYSRSLSRSNPASDDYDVAYLPRGRLGPWRQKLHTVPKGLESMRPWWKPPIKCPPNFTVIDGVCTDSDGVTAEALPIYDKLS